MLQTFGRLAKTSYAAVVETLLPALLFGCAAVLLIAGTYAVAQVLLAWIYGESLAAPRREED